MEQGDSLGNYEAQLIAGVALDHLDVCVRERLGRYGHRNTRAGQLFAEQEVFNEVDTLSFPRRKTPRRTALNHWAVAEVAKDVPGSQYLRAHISATAQGKRQILAQG